jgi:hypothetical protein
MLRDVATGRQEGRELRMLHILMFEQIGHHMGESVEATRAEAIGAQAISGLGSCAAPVFEQGNGSSQGTHEPLQHVGNAVARPRLGHRHGSRMHMVETRGAGVPVVMPSVEGQHGEELAGAKRDGDIDDPEEAIGEGVRTQGNFGHGGRLLESSDREPGDPVDHALRTRRLGQSQGGSQHAQDATHGSKADASPHKELQGEVNYIDFTLDGGHRGRWALSTELSLGLRGAFLLGISVAFETFEFLA